MMKQDDAEGLRGAAEARLQAGVPTDAALAEVDLRCLVHELQVHQIELEMQNHELRQARAELGLALTNYTELYDFAPVAYFTFDRRGSIRQVNLVGARMLVADRAPLIGRRFADFIAIDARRIFADLLDRAFASRGREACDIALLCEDRSSSQPFVHIEVVLRGAGDTFSAVVIDISEKKRAEDKLRRLSLAVEQTPLSIVITDPDGGIEYANAAYAATSGYAIEEALGRNPRFQQSGQTPRETYDALWQTLARGETWSGEFINRRKNGETCVEFAIITPVRQADGHSRGAISAFVDITARRAAEHAMQAAKAEAERANNAKSRFLAAASHDLRQPLSALSIYVNVLKGHVDPAGQPMLANMKDCIGSLSELLSDLLDLSKLEAGVVRPNLSDFPLDDTLASLISVHAPEAQLKGLRLRCVSSRLTAHTDPVLFQRILGNFIDNAIRYTEHGGVLVACRRRLGKRWIEVWDTGIGIAADNTVEIFEEFKQLGDAARNRGSGLGLAIVAGTAALLGLEISVRSRPGHGSVFAVELPLGQAAAIAAGGPSSIAFRSLRIALVEDNTMVREAFVHALQGAGHQVVAAATGEELRAGLGSLPPDIVVSDYRLCRGETGFDVITALRAASGVDLPAILITGDTDPKLLRSMADRGIIVLHKPVDLETLQAYLEDLTSQK